MVLSPSFSALCALVSLFALTNADSGVPSASIPASTPSSVSAISSSGLLSSQFSSLSSPSASSTVLSSGSSTGLSSGSSVSSTVLSSGSSVLSSAVSSSSTSIPVSSTVSSPVPATSPATETPIIPPISSYTFSPYAVPSDAPLSKVYPETYPHDPPSVDSQAIPDFGPAWAAAYKKAKAAIADLSLEQKVNFSTGVGWLGGRCVGNTPPVGDFPGLCLEDSPLGVRDTDYATVFPAGVNTAATWNRDLIRARGVALGQEFKGKGVHVALGPMMNLGRQAAGGRNWEGFGADPFLSGASAYETILGMQKAGVQACAKHYINNEQEHSRTTSSSNVDDRTQHELYAQPFLKSVMAGVASVMCSYNLINGTWACENDKMLNDVLKREYGFQGYIMSDWAAQHSTISAITGLDMTMPGDVSFGSGDSYFGGNLTAYVQNNTIPESRVDDMATRILAGYYLLNQDAPDYPNVNFNAFLPLDEATNEHVNVQDDHYKIVREIGAASSVLLKNLNCALPLKKPRSLAIIGSDARPAMGGPNMFSDNGGSDGILAMGWGSGTANFSYLISPVEAIQARARLDSTSLDWFFDDFNLLAASDVAQRKSAALVFVNSDSGEDYITVDGNEGDRNNLTAWHNGDNLIRAIAAVNENTIVIVNSVGPLVIEPWIEHPNVTAVLWAGISGTEIGNAIADVLYGDWNPSGRLPYTIAKQQVDYPAQIVLGGTNTDIISIPYTEGLLVDYRWFDAKNVTPRYEFGYGLSYTSFGYSSINVKKISQNALSEEETKWDSGKASSSVEVGSSRALWLHRPAYSVTFKLQNTGTTFGGEIPQVYVHHPTSAGEPPSLLKGFTHVELAPGQTKSVEITMSKYDLSIWDVENQGWRKPTGDITLSVGASSRDFKLAAKIPN